MESPRSAAPHSEGPGHPDRRPAQRTREAGATPSFAPQPPGPTPRRGNPLRRRSDTLREWLPGLLALGLAVAAALSVLLGVLTFVADRTAAARQAEKLHRVTAVAVEQPFVAGVGVWIAKVDWTDATGTHAAQARVSASTGPGDHVVVWVDRGDVPQAPPASVDQSAGAAVTYTVAAFAGAATLLIGVHAWARYELNKRAERSWDKEWALVEPEWNRWGRRG